MKIYVNKLMYKFSLQTLIFFELLEQNKMGLIHKLYINPKQLAK